LIDQFTKLM